MAEPEPHPSAPGDELALVLRLVQETARATGESFFQSVVRNLSGALGVAYAFVAEFAGSPDRVRTLAFWGRGALQENVEYELAGTPCEEVTRGERCHHVAGLQRAFPRDTMLVDIGAEGYLGVPLLGRGGEVLGHLAVLHTGPMPLDARRLAIFEIFAARGAAELERLRLERTLAESEERLRDLFDEAPIAYVHEDLESRFLRANRTAMRTLGITPEEVPNMVGRSLVPDTPEAQRLVREAFESISRGTDTSGVVLQLRRKDDGRPIWIQWWSRPDPSGAYTRTMFIDITDRVLMEQKQARLEAQNLYLREEIQSVHNFEEIVGRSPGLVRVLDDVKRVAPTDASVLITGETGTGKELIARAIHSNSRRRDKPLIKLNCAALPTSLVESELFGHEKGAFSGAIAQRIGRFELAQGGTIFLDEIGEVSSDVQVKLLRVLQEREFERVGGGTPIPIDVRIIAATNRDLDRAMADGRFREDLYYRLNVFPVHLPPLRERADDVPLLASFFLGKVAARIGKRADGITRDTMERLQRYPWPGNVRELENFIERAVILAPGPVLEVEEGVLRAPPAAPPGPRAARPAAQDPAPARDLEPLSESLRRHVLDALEACGWRVEGPEGAAQRLGLQPSTLRSRMKKMGLRRGEG
jgi:PAS domain S-box-containing protein